MPGKVLLVNSKEEIIERPCIPGCLTTRGNSMITYKLLKIRKDGTLGPLFIERARTLPLNETLTANKTPTKGYKVRPGWHSTLFPYAPHISVKGRVWVKCEVPGVHFDTDLYPELFTKQGDMNNLPVGGWYYWERPERQGRLWVISHEIKLLEILLESSCCNIN